MCHDVLLLLLVARKLEDGAVLVPDVLGAQIECLVHRAAQ